MSLFNQLVTEALLQQKHLSSLRPVVEKELIHHDILNIMSTHGLLKRLTFMGGTALRACYGGTRLSEDLDFTGGHDFSRKELSHMGQCLKENLQQKYGLQVEVQEPMHDKKNVDTWKIRIQTRPESKHLPAQRIHLDICAIKSYERQPMMLLNPYGVDMGTRGLIIQTQSQEEIYADKLIAFANRPNRIKHRDIWDILWMHEQGLQPNMTLVPQKLKGRMINPESFLNAFEKRLNSLSEQDTMQNNFKHEMQRFLPLQNIQTLTQQDGWWNFIIYLMREHFKKLKLELR